MSMLHAPPVRLLFSMDSVSRVKLDGNTFGSVPVRELLSADGTHAFYANFKVGDNGCIALASHWHS